MKTWILELNTTMAELELISKIANRLIEMGARGEKIDIVMDLEATHHSTPLDLQGLLNSKDGDFAHDMIGIYANLNRNTGKLENCFIPRFAAKQ